MEDHNCEQCEQLIEKSLAAEAEYNAAVKERDMWVERVKTAKQDLDNLQVREAVLLKEEKDDKKRAEPVTKKIETATPKKIIVDEKVPENAENPIGVRQKPASSVFDRLRNPAPPPSEQDIVLDDEDEDYEPPAPVRRPAVASSPEIQAKFTATSRPNFMRERSAPPTMDKSGVKKNMWSTLLTEKRSSFLPSAFSEAPKRQADFAKNRDYESGPEDEYKSPLAAEDARRPQYGNNDYGESREQQYGNNDYGERQQHGYGGTATGQRGGYSQQRRPYQSGGFGGRGGRGGRGNGNGGNFHNGNRGNFHNGNRGNFRGNYGQHERYTYE